MKNANGFLERNRKLALKNNNTPLLCSIVLYSIIHTERTFKGEAVHTGPSPQVLKGKERAWNAWSKNQEYHKT